MSDVKKKLIDALDRYLRQDETAGDTDNGVYRQGQAAMSDALTSAPAEPPFITAMIDARRERYSLDQSCTPAFLHWLDTIAPREGVGANEAWNAGVEWQKTHGAPADPWITQMAEQANLIDRERLEKWLVAYGISTGESRERFSALVGEHVNYLTREEPFSAPAETPPAAGAIDARGQEAGREVPIAPDVCPITGRKFWGNMDHPERGMVALYGGPYDSYSIPELCDDGELRCEHYDQDAGEWEEGGVPAGWFFAEQPELASREKAPAAAQAAPFGIIDPDYARYYTLIRTTAWQCGYAIGLHGSFTRDLDLIAVPWTPQALPPDLLVKQIEYRTDLKRQEEAFRAKPHGRMCWSLLLPGFTDPRWIDLSVMAALASPPEAPAAAGAAQAVGGWQAMQDDPRVNEIVSALYRRFKDWSMRGFTADDVTWCEVKAEIIKMFALAATPAPETMPSHQEMADAMAAAPRGFMCPLCGRDYPHPHSPEEIIIYRNGVKWGRSNGKESWIRPNRAGLAQDEGHDAGATGSARGPGADQHLQHRTGQSDDHRAGTECDSQGAGVSGESPIRETVALKAAQPIEREDGK